jgi:DNA-directed RNA polymerase subunit F
MLTYAQLAAKREAVEAKRVREELRALVTRMQQEMQAREVTVA